MNKLHVPPSVRRTTGTPRVVFNRIVLVLIVVLGLTGALIAEKTLTQRRQASAPTSAPQQPEHLSPRVKLSAPSGEVPGEDRFTYRNLVAPPAQGPVRTQEPIV